MLVHPGQLARVHAVGLALEPAGDQRGAGGGDHDGDGAGAEDQWQLPVVGGGDVVDLEPGRHQGGYRSVRGGHRDGRLDFVAQRAVHALGVDLPVQGGADGADEPVADLARHRVRVADSLVVHDDDEVDAGDFAGGLGDRLENRRGIGRLECGEQAGRMREGLRDRDRPVLRLGIAAPPRLQDLRQDRPEHEEDHDHEFQREYLSGYAASVSRCRWLSEYDPRSVGMFDHVVMFSTMPGFSCQVLLVVSFLGFLPFAFSTPDSHSR